MNQSIQMVSSITHNPYSIKKPSDIMSFVSCISGCSRPTPVCDGTIIQDPPYMNMIAYNLAVQLALADQGDRAV